MDKKELKSINHDFLNHVSDVLENARKNAKTAVNLSMVYAYYEIGRMIVEEGSKEKIVPLMENDFYRSCQNF